MLEHPSNTQIIHFKNECKLVNLKYEYSNYNGSEKWAIITKLTEEELLEKYFEIIQKYKPFILLSDEHGKVFNEYNKNEDKFRKRQLNYGELYGYEDGITEIHNYNDFQFDFSEKIVQSDWVKKALKKLSPIQQERIIKYYFLGKNASEIAKEEGVSSQAIDKSIHSAIKKLKCILNQLD